MGRYKDREIDNEEYVDGVGGTHYGSSGIDPDGGKCPKCYETSCGRCRKWLRKANNQQKRFEKEYE